jgi:hypothetical protein
MKHWTKVLQEMSLALIIFLNNWMIGNKKIWDVFQSYQGWPSCQLGEPLMGFLHCFANKGWRTHLNFTSTSFKYWTVRTVHTMHEKLKIMCHSICVEIGYKPFDRNPKSLYEVCVWFESHVKNYMTLLSRVSSLNCVVLCRKICV